MNTILRLALSIALVDCPLALAKLKFNSSEIEGQGSEIISCDLDGDHLKDAVLVDGMGLSIFYQDSERGFSRKPQQRFRLDERPSIVWPARFGSKAESVLVMTSEGVTELCFTNRTGPPARRLIIEQQTIIPDALDEPQAMCFPLTAETRTDRPLLLVPVAGGLQVWQYREAWNRTQFVEHAVDAHLQPSVTNPGYTQLFGLNLSLADVNGDGRDDLMVMRDVAGRRQTYTLYLQNADGLLTPEPALIHTNHADWRTTLCWVDINRDGRLDLIKSTFLDEPFFIPGMRSGKVLVGACLADEDGRIPIEPQQVFRKNDWSSSLPMVDVDGDGCVDLVLGDIPVDTREGLRRVITSEQLDFSLKFRFYRPGAGFPREPDHQRGVFVHFHRRFILTYERRLYYEQFITLNGDFNGDGRKDLLVRDRSRGISAYFFVSREKGFSPEADLRFDCSEPMDWWEVKDLNGDGVSDLIVKFWRQDAFRIFTSQSK